MVPASPLLFRLLWGLTLLGLLIRALRQPSLAGTYEPKLDELLYAGQRLLDGQLLYVGLVNGTLPVAQWLYAPSAWLGSLPAHRLWILAVNALAGGLLAGALRNFARAGLIAFAPGSMLPLAAATAFVGGSQLVPGGLSGLPEHFANAFLVLGLFGFSRLVAAGVDQAPSLRLELASTGAALALAQQCAPRLTSPLLMVILLALLMLRIPRPVAVVWPLLAGGLVAGLLPFAPYLLVAGGASLAWAGAVQLPLEQAARLPAESDRLLPLLGDFLRLNLAGLPVWLLAIVPCVALVDFAVRRARQPFGRGDQLLLLPVLALFFLLETLQAFLRGGFESEERMLLVLPTVMLMACGFAVMEAHNPWRRRLASVALLVLSLIVFNNVFLTTLLHTPRQPAEIVRELEADRGAARRALLAQPAGLRGFTAPQDVALQRQLRQRATTTGIGPEWSLNQQNLPPSWATRRLALPTDPSTSCRQLTDPSNHHLVWMRTDPDGPNTEAFFRACLDREPGQWQDISADLKLTTGEYRVFRRRALPAPAPGAQPAP
ncbi:MAG: hypothetical protein ACK59G_07965 [Cyanobacteriota bacterium]